MAIISLLRTIGTLARFKVFASYNLVK